MLDSRGSEIREPNSLAIFFFNDTATTEIYTLSLHDALPISPHDRRAGGRGDAQGLPEAQAHRPGADEPQGPQRDRKSTRLNSSHANISYAVFCLKKKTTTPQLPRIPYSVCPLTTKYRSVYYL